MWRNLFGGPWIIFLFWSHRTTSRSFSCIIYPIISHHFSIFQGPTLRYFFLFCTAQDVEVSNKLPPVENWVGAEGSDIFCLKRCSCIQRIGKKRRKTPKDSRDSVDTRVVRHGKTSLWSIMLGDYYVSSSQDNHAPQKGSKNKTHVWNSR